MRTLLNEQYAPITSSAGYLRAPLAEVVRAMVDWRRSLYGDVHTRSLDGDLPSALQQLAPLTGGARPRELLVAVGEWTAYFDCLLDGTDAITAVGALASKLQCQGVAIETVPHTIGLPGTKVGRQGAVQFTLFGPIRTDFLNHVRTVSVVYDGGWHFNADGTVQDFEEVDVYRSRRVGDRFTSDMLERYCAALGFAVFDPAAYGPESVLIESRVPMAPDGLVINLDRAQDRLGITPGVAATLPR